MSSEEEAMYQSAFNEAYVEGADGKELILAMLAALEFANSFIPRGEPMRFPVSRAMVDSAIRMAKEAGYEYEW